LDGLAGCDDRPVRGWPAVLCATLAIAACGDEPTKFGSPAPRPEATPRQVIRAWANTLRSGDTEGAAAYFGLPSLVSNGTPPIVLRSRSEVRRFNESLPCGAVLERTYRQGRYTAAVFRLTERPGRGRCGTGTGASARTAFIVRGGKIREWRRLAEPEAPPAPVV
jgi:hypothetical protein